MHVFSYISGFSKSFISFEINIIEGESEQQPEFVFTRTCRLNFLQKVRDVGLSFSEWFNCDGICSLYTADDFDIFLPQNTLRW